MFKRFSVIMHMHKKNIIFAIFSLFLVSCGHLIEDEYFIERCADIKTAKFWENEATSLKEQILKEKEKYKQSETRAEKKQNKYNLREKKYLYELHRRASRETLGHKLHIFSEYDKNFVKCDTEHYENPKLFRKLYR